MLDWLLVYWAVIGQFQPILLSHWLLLTNSSIWIKGYPTEENFKVVEDDVPELRKGEILCRALYISIDPITR